jgi:integrase
MVKQVIDKALFWRYIPVCMNPMTLVKVIGSSKRKNKIQLFTPDQTNLLIEEMKQPYSDMIVVAAELALRVSEVFALQWPDFDLEREDSYDLQRVHE